MFSCSKSPFWGGRLKKSPDMGPRNSMCKQPPKVFFLSNISYLH